MFIGDSPPSAPPDHPPRRVWWCSKTEDPLNPFLTQTPLQRRACVDGRCVAGFTPCRASERESDGSFGRRQDRPSRQLTLCGPGSRTPSGVNGPEPHGSRGRSPSGGLLNFRLSLFSWRSGGRVSKPWTLHPQPAKARDVQSASCAVSRGRAGLGRGRQRRVRENPARSLRARGLRAGRLEVGSKSTFPRGDRSGARSSWRGGKNWWCQTPDGPRGQERRRSPPSAGEEHVWMRKNPRKYRALGDGNIHEGRRTRPAAKNLEIGSSSDG